MRVFLPMLALTALAAPQIAQACSYAQRPEDVGQASGQYFASEMAKAAAYVDLVLVESEGLTSDRRQSGSVITLRTIARFKGASADRFTVFGNLMTDSDEAKRIFDAPLLHFTSEMGHVTPFSYNEERVFRLLPDAVNAAPPPPVVMTSCSPPLLAAQMGRFYVVMRDAEGRVLNRVTMNDGTTAAPNHPAFGFVPVILAKGDFWLHSVSLAVRLPVPDTKPELLYLRSGSDLARAESALRSAGARIRAAYYDRGGFIEEVRPSPEEQGRPWLASALPFLQQNAHDRSTLAPHAAGEFLRANLSQMRRYDNSLSYEVAQAFTRSIRQHGLGNTSPRLVAIEVADDPDRYAGLEFVERVAPLGKQPDRLPPIEGADEGASFASMQRVERDIWLINGGAGNPQGTLQ